MLYTNVQAVRGTAMGTKRIQLGYIIKLGNRATSVSTSCHRWR